MSRLDNILKEVDDFINTRGHSKVASATSSVNDSEVASLIDFLQKEASSDRVTDPISENSLIEKIAHYTAVSGALDDIAFWTKASELEKMATERGHSKEQIAAAIEKFASQRVRAKGL